MRSARRAHELEEEFPLVDAVREALAEEHPLELLHTVSLIIQATEPRHWALSDPDEPEAVNLGELIDSFIATKLPETTVLLAVLSELLDNEVLRTRCEREVAARDDDLPQWITDLGRTHVERVVRMTHVLGEGDELMLGVKLSSGQEMTCAAFIDHTVVSEVKDAFFVPAPLQEVLDVATRSRTDPDTTFVEMSLADARAWLHRGVEVDGLLSMLSESDTWPASRPLLQWLTRGLPEGGSGYQPPFFSEDQIEELLDRFFATVPGLRFDDSGHRDLLRTCIDEGTGDPLRWSAGRLRDLPDVFLPLDEYSDERSIQDLLDLPDVMRAYVPFAHAESGIRDELTAEAQAAIDEFESEFREMVLEDARYLDDDDDDDDDGDPS
ncbi:hypothetical protein Mkiyose1665_29920 [Mycobacterium kiyosense]|uniref:Uncharacterized protein n=2 Tax=Mycobacteriaceae TaxID=1762 RepID=A0A9P3Q468_9MYCO|nr:hypothetical protein IWGMT90018_14610 [Mycobacterium kiyosense]BDE12814.1 hypothetical protein MKCMC460_16740 [Mycobacterium sp. 20KCMC460]GLB82488.1 hypothetical protein SRL2020028_17440 [Mycobacterium kiyosense]GLB90307.1 hypothetical protein SRL2020130_31240 [Mycobacterium kiyosense]GLB93910.1 hypothetical protein SRL2020226_06860 [Mycobacterium kiyosense]